MHQDVETPRRKTLRSRSAAGTHLSLQAKALFGEGLVTAPVKEAAGRYAARMFPLVEAQMRLKSAAKEALLGRKAAPFRLEPPFTFEFEFQNSGQTEMPLMLPDVKRTSARSLSFTAADYLDGFRLMRAIIALAAA